MAEPGPGDKPLNLDGDGKVVGGLPADRILDPNVLKGANGGRALPPELYAQASPSRPSRRPARPGRVSHVLAPPEVRAAEGTAYQGGPRAAAPQTPAGVRVAEVSLLAARLVTPPLAHEPGPVKDLYPAAHPVLDEFGKVVVPVEAALKRDLGFVATPRMAQQYQAGLQKIMAGENPAPLPSDPPVTPEHAAAAKGLHDHLMDLADHQKRTGPSDASVQALAAHAVSLRDGDRTEPAHDERAMQTAEVAAMLPGIGAVPAVLDRHLARAPAAAAAPAAPVRIRLPFLGDDDFDVLPVYAEDDDEFGALGSGMALALALALDGWACGHPRDGRRRRPPVRPCDPRLGAFFDNDGERRRREEEARRWEARFGRLADGWDAAAPVAGYAAPVYAAPAERRAGSWTAWSAAEAAAETASRGRPADRSGPRGRRRTPTAPPAGTSPARRPRAHPTEGEQPGRRRDPTRPGPTPRRVRTRWRTSSPPSAAHAGRHRDRPAGPAPSGDWGRRTVRGPGCLVDQPPLSARAYAAATQHVPGAVRALLGGERVHGYDLRALRAGAAARGLALPDALTDPRLGGPGHWHGGGGGGGHFYGWGPAVVQPVYAPACVDPTDPADPCYDPSLGGVGDLPAAGGLEPAILSEVRAHRAAVEGPRARGLAALDELAGPPAGQSVAAMVSQLRAALAGGGPAAAPCGPSGPVG